MPPWYNWSIVESGIKHHKPKPNPPPPHLNIPPWYNLSIVESGVKHHEPRPPPYKGVGLGYGRWLHFHCLLKYMVICAFENPPSIPRFLATQIVYIDMGSFNLKPEALKSLYRSPGNKKNQLVLCKNYVLRHLGITINIKNTKFVKDLPMIDAQFRFNQCNSFREEYISVFSPYGSVLILWPVVAAILDFWSA